MKRSLYRNRVSDSTFEISIEACHRISVRESTWEVSGTKFYKSDYVLMFLGFILL